MDEQVIAIEQEIFGQTLEELLPSIAPIVAGLLEKALPDYKITWTKFDSGADVNTAFIAKELDFGALGSSPVARGLSAPLNIRPATGGISSCSSVAPWSRSRSSRTSLTSRCSAAT